VKLETQWVNWSAGAETVRVFLARPAVVAQPIPAIVVIQEIWGVDDHIQDLVGRYAAAGYYAVAPDLFATDGRRPVTLAPERIRTVVRVLDTLPSASWSDAAARDAAVDRLPESERAGARETIGVILNPNRPTDRYLALLRATCAALRHDPACTGRIVSVGYCYGGLLSARLAGLEPELGAAVIYYGMSPDVALLPNLRCPLLGFYGELDTRITSTVPAFAEALRRAGKRFESHVYPQAPHAFFNDTRPAYHVDAARDAWARTLMFFATELRSA
jgi:carboxymethylenebutenolidase